MLDDRGRAQAAELATRLAKVPLAAIISSPLERCVQTAQAIADGRLPDGDTAGTLAVEADERFGECRYGSWTGRPLAELVKEPLWRVVQAHPSAVTFPDGESMLDLQHRAVSAVREWNARLGKDATYVICSHGDVIKTIVADSLGMHLDQCQRIQADPCSLTVIRYTPLRPFVIRMNDKGGELDDLLPRPEEHAAAGKGDDLAQSDAAIGGGAGGGAVDAPVAGSTNAEGTAEQGNDDVGTPGGGEGCDGGEGGTSMPDLVMEQSADARG